LDIKSVTRHERLNKEADAAANRAAERAWMEMADSGVWREGSGVWREEVFGERRPLEEEYNVPQRTPLLDISPSVTRTSSSLPALPSGRPGEDSDGAIDQTSRCTSFSARRKTETAERPRRDSASPRRRTTSASGPRSATSSNASTALAIAYLSKAFLTQEFASTAQTIQLLTRAGIDDDFSESTLATAAIAALRADSKTSKTSKTSQPWTTEKLREKLPRRDTPHTAGPCRAPTASADIETLEVMPMNRRTSRVVVSKEAAKEAMQACGATAEAIDEVLRILEPLADELQESEGGKKAEKAKMVAEAQAEAAAQRLQIEEELVALIYLPFPMI